MAITIHQSGEDEFTIEDHSKANAFDMEWCVTLNTGQLRELIRDAERLLAQTKP